MLLMNKKRLLMKLMATSILVYIINISRRSPDSTDHEKDDIFMRGIKRGQLLIYNRVRKCGSGTMLSLLEDLQENNTFKVYTASPDKYVMSKYLQAQTAKYIHGLSRPACHVAHYAYINFTSYGYFGGIYINMIRDPVEKFISEYFFRRISMKSAKMRGDLSQKVKRTNARFLNCFKSEDADCKHIRGDFDSEEKLITTIPFFCGHEEFCLIKGNRDALSKAKRTIEKDYTVVGILEDLSTTIKVLEHKIPQFFKGAYKKFLNRMEERRTHKIDKSVIEDELQIAKDELRRNMSLEYELYNFVRSRLYKQLFEIIDSKDKFPANGTFQETESTKLFEY